MVNLKNKILSLTVVVCLCLYPLFSNAQNDTDANDLISSDSNSENVSSEIIETENVSTSLDEQAKNQENVDSIIVTEVVPGVETQNSVSDTQNNASPQTTDVSQIPVTNSDLNPTFNPHNTDTNLSSTAITEIVDSAPTNSIEIPINHNSQNSTPDNESGGTNIFSDQNNFPTTATIINTVTITEVIQQPSLPDTISTVTVDKLNPEFTFEISGNLIPTKEKPDWQKTEKEINSKINSNQIFDAPNLSINNGGTLDISGQCEDSYFVILIYSNPDEYDKDPGSYIFNKAFDCVNGGYSYSLKDLPKNIKDGTYYLLVGSQGSVGSWKPITALIPINIKNENE